MSHHEHARKQQQETEQEKRTSQLSLLRDKANPALDQLEQIVQSTRYLVGQDQHQHLNQKLLELKLLMIAYTT